MTRKNNFLVYITFIKHSKNNVLCIIYWWKYNLLELKYCISVQSFIFLKIISEKLPSFCRTYFCSLVSKLPITIGSIVAATLFLDSPGDYYRALFFLKTSKGKIQKNKVVKTNRHSCSYRRYIARYSPKQFYMITYFSAFRYLRSSRVKLEEKELIFIVNDNSFIFIGYKQAGLYLAQNTVASWFYCIHFLPVLRYYLVLCQVSFTKFPTMCFSSVLSGYRPKRASFAFKNNMVWGFFLYQAESTRGEIIV